MGLLLLRARSEEPDDGFKRVASDPRIGDVCVDGELEEQAVEGLDLLG